MKPHFLRKDPLYAAGIIFLAAVSLIGLPDGLIGTLLPQEAETARSLWMAICRLLAAGVMLAALIRLGFSRALSLRERGISLKLLSLFALLIALNNLPLLPLLEGKASVSAPAARILLFAAECAAVGLFEEIAFRGLIFPLFLQHAGTGKGGRLFAVALSSALFGGLHFANLLSGEQLLETLLQVGYSAMIGAMFAVLMFGGASVFFCALLHAVFNFCGTLTPRFGAGALWTPLSVALTVLLDLFAFLLFFAALMRSDGSSAADWTALTATDRFRLAHCGRLPSRG